MNAIREPCYNEPLQKMFQKKVSFIPHSVFLTLGFNLAHNRCVNLSLYRRQNSLHNGHNI